LQEERFTELVNNVGKNKQKEVNPGKVSVTPSSVQKVVVFWWLQNNRIDVLPDWRHG